MRSGRIIKPNQTFYAHLDEIPEAFRDVIVPVDGLPEEEQEITLATATGYEVQERVNTKGWHDVVNLISGKPINEKALRKDEAEKLLAELG